MLSSLLTAVNRLETTALYAQVATDLLREVTSPLENLHRTYRTEHFRARSRGRLPRAWAGVATDRTAEPGTAEGHVGNRTVPQCGAGWTCVALFRLQTDRSRLQFLPYGKCFPMGIRCLGASTERTPRPFNSPLKLGPEHGDYLIGRPKRTPAQMRRDDRVEGFELLSWISPSVDFSGRQIAMPEP